MNRNYAYKFGFDNKGSSDKPCAEDYRGPEAFSESETAAIRNFLLKYKNIRLAVNYHA